MSHPWPADASFDGGDLDCGSGLLLLIRRHLDPLEPGGLIEIVSTEISVVEDLPAWCRLTGNELVSHLREGRRSSFLVSKGAFRAPLAKGARVQAPMPREVVEVTRLAALPSPSPAPPLPALAVMGIGSWPRPRWLLEALHQHLQGRLPGPDWQQTADDAVQLAVAAQLRAGVDLVTDGEQRRDNYASFVAEHLENCQLVPLTDLLPYVDDPETFRRELDQLDVPSEKVRHPAVFGPLGRRPSGLAHHELLALQQLTKTPAKVALPGPYLLTRTMWMECISDRAYADREALAQDIVAVLREEIAVLLAAGAALVQLDEPVLTEVVFGRPSAQRTFMCGALGARGEPAQELAFARQLWQDTLRGLPVERLALHVCRGNWTPDESAALSGDYGPLLEVLAEAPVGALLLEACTHRAGDLAVLQALPRDKRLGLGMVDQKRPEVEDADAIARRLERAAGLFGAERLLVHPDCGFATFADNPLASGRVAEHKLTALRAGVERFRGR